MLYDFSYGLASARAGKKNRLAKIVENITKTTTSVNKLKRSYFLFHSTNPGSARPQY